MKFKSLFSTIALLVLCFAISCKKKEIAPLDKLPPATQYGANTLGFLVNGRAWEQGRGWGLYVSIDYAKGYLHMRNYGSIDGKTEGALIINLTNVFSEGIYTCVGPNDFIYNDGKSSNRCHGCFTSFAEVSITRLDTINRIVSGTFHFEAWCNQDSSVIDISDGRFDYSYPYGN